MSAASNASNSIARFVKRSSGWSVALSISLIIAGIAAIIIPPAASIAVTIFVGWVLIFSGVIHLVYAWHTRGAGGIIWEVLLGLLYIAVGIYLLRNPILGMASLTLALGMYLFIEAMLEFVLSYQLRETRGWGWLLFDGIVTLVLAALIWMTWPSGSVWVLGTLVGVSMLFSGVARLLVSLTARKLIPAAI